MRGLVVKGLATTSVALGLAVLPALAAPSAEPPAEHTSGPAVDCDIPERTLSLDDMQAIVFEAVAAALSGAATQTAPARQRKAAGPNRRPARNSARRSAR